MAEIKAGLSIRMLGTFEAAVDGERIEPKAWGRKKTQDLLKVLLSDRGRTFTQDQLIDLLYPEADPTKVLKNLRGRVSELRKALEPGLSKGPDSQYILSVGQGYCFNPDIECWLDLEAFEQGLNTAADLADTERWAAALDAYERALALYRADFLEEDAYEDWALAPREHWQTRYTNALEAAALCHLHLGRQRQAIELCEQVLTKDACRESAFRLKMRACFQNGDRQQALSVYDACLKTLQQQLGVEPSAQTQALLEQIERGERIDQQKVSPNNLPHTLASFVGRERELGELSQHLDEPACRLLNIVGPGGIGKSRLSLEAATQQLDHFADGVFWVPLAAVPNSDLLPNAIAQALRFSFYGQEPPQQQLANYLRDKHMLLVLDNMEHLADAAPQLGEVLSVAQRVQCLATSRAKLSVEGERAYRLEGLAVPKANDDDWERFGAIQMFAAAAQRADARYQIQAEKQSIIAICDLVGGSPLAIELAASWVEVLPCAEILAEIQSSVAFLSAELEALPARQRSVRATFEYSWALLSDEERRGIAELSTFRGGFERSAGQAVAGLGATALSNLINKSFVRRVSSTRFEMHELLRQFAAEKLKALADWDQAHERHAQYFLQTLVRGGKSLIGDAQAEALAQLETEINNVRSAWRWLQHAPQETLKDGLDGLFLFYDIKGWIQEGKQVFVDLRQALQGEGALRGKVPARLGWFEFRLGNMDQARALYLESLNIAQAAQNKFDLAFVSNYLGILERILGNKQQAQHHHQQDYDLSTELKDQFGQARSLLNLGNVAQESGDYSGAKNHFQQSLNAFSAIGNRLGMGKALGNMGLVSRIKGEPDKARDLYLRALEIDREMDDHLGITMMLGNLGNVARELGDLEQARDYQQEAYDYSENMSERYLMAVNGFNLGLVLFDLGQSDQAETLMRAAYHRASAIQALPLLMSFIVEMAALPTRLGKRALAVEALCMVSAHPATASETKAQAQALLDQLKEELSEKSFKAAAKRGTETSLEELGAKLFTSD